MSFNVSFEFEDKLVSGKRDAYDLCDMRISDENNVCQSSDDKSCQSFSLFSSFAEWLPKVGDFFANKKSNLVLGAIDSNFSFEVFRKKGNYVYVKCGSKHFDEIEDSDFITALWVGFESFLYENKNEIELSQEIITSINEAAIEFSNLCKKRAYKVDGEKFLNLFKSKKK